MELSSAIPNCIKEIQEQVKCLTANFENKAKKKDTLSMTPMKFYENSM